MSALSPDRLPRTFLALLAAAALAPLSPACNCGGDGGGGDGGDGGGNSDGGGDGGEVDAGNGPTLSFADAGSSGGESSTLVQLVVELSEPLPADSATVDVLASGGSAAKGPDYALRATSVTIPAGQTQGMVDLDVVQDLLDELDETVVLSLSNPRSNHPDGVRLGATSDHVYTITDDDPQPTVSFGAATSDAGEAVANPAIPVVLSTASGRAVAVNCSPSGGSAGGTDYSMASPATLIFPAGTTQAGVPLTLVNDDQDEPAETLQLTLSSPAGASLAGTTSHTLTIQDNDPPPTVQFAVSNSMDLESTTAVFLVVSLSAPSAFMVTVDYAVTGGTATGADYSLVGVGRLSFSGVQNQNIRLNITSDGTVESDETVQITLSMPVNATLGTRAVHTHTILDDDTPPVVQFALASSSDSEGVTSPAVAVTLSRPSTQTIGVSFTTLPGGIATGGGVDYSLGISPLTFSPGVTSRSLPFSVTEDPFLEVDETIVFQISSPTGGATLGSRVMHTYTILNND